MCSLGVVLKNLFDKILVFIPMPSLIGTATFVSFFYCHDLPSQLQMPVKQDKGQRECCLCSYNACEAVRDMSLVVLVLDKWQHPLNGVGE